MRRYLAVYMLLLVVLHSFASSSALSQSRGATAKFQWWSDIDSASYTAESHPGDDTVIAKMDLKTVNVTNGSWIAFNQFDFGQSLSYLWIEVASEQAFGHIELRVGGPAGVLLGTVAVQNTGGKTLYKPLGLKLPRPIRGVHDLYLCFYGGRDNQFNLGRFRFQQLAPDFAKTALTEDAVLPVQAGPFTNAGSFSLESDPQDDNRVRSDAGKINYIQNGTWVAYKDFDFRTGVRFFSIAAGSKSDNNRIEIVIDRPDGPAIASIKIGNTGDFSHFRTFETSLAREVSGTHDLYFRFIGQGGYLFDLGAFRFLSVAPAVKAQYSELNASAFERESHPNREPIVVKGNEVSSIVNGTWIAYSNFNFGDATDLITIEAATPNNGGVIEIRTNTANGTLVGMVDVTYTGSWSHYRPFTAKLNSPLSGRQHLFFRFVSLDGSQEPLFNLRRFIFGKKDSKAIRTESGRLHVYPPVPGMEPSPYYELSVQKLSELNSANKEEATNWEHPFAWFTRCVDFEPEKKVAYFHQFIGSWSQTYCNFEMDSTTPIVVKITRLNKPGAPSGPITMANAYPAHKIKSCEVIDGEVYVTMDKPALVAIDIDGQMDTRDAPRAIPNKWGDEPFPYRDEKSGVHSVTIFANPFIDDKPSLNDPDVFAVKPGERPPANGPWKTLYFLPGIHNLSVDENGNEREWVKTDPLFLQSNKNYYIPGDAIVYGNFNDGDDDLASVNIRVFGHGTLSGTKIPHWKDFSGGELPDEDHKHLRMLHLTRASNCIYEGITIADPAEHGAYIQGYGFDHQANRIAWLKNISWRVNNDGGGVTGNGYVEDCFFRHQDDGLYVRGIAIRRCIFWSDVNGTPLRCSFITNDRGADYPMSLPPDLIIEDCDVIYSRGVFAFDDATSFGVIATPGASDSTKHFEDGTVNTGQHVLFKNIRVTDPRPVRYLFGFDAEGDKHDTQQPPWAGLRFENVEYRHPHTWNWKNRLLGSSSAPIHHWSFKQVSISGQPLDLPMLSNPQLFEVKHVSDMRIQAAKPVP